MNQTFDVTRLPDFDPAHDIMHYERQALDAIFVPKTVALVGATESPGSVGRTILWNLISSPFGGTVFPVNPKRNNVLGIKAYPSIGEIPEPVDLAVIVTPAKSVPAIIRDCVRAGVKGAIVISAGFKETGPEGAELERQIMEYARKGNMRIIGPNCLGVMSPITGLNATFASKVAHPGKVAFISQSGALLTAVLDWSFENNVGFSSFVSIGSMLDVGWGDLIYYLGDDPQTESIVLYMESIGDARSFMSAAREVSLTKPIIAIKPGRTAGAAKAAASHTGSLTGSDEVLDVAFRRAGVLRVNSISELFHMADLLSKQPAPKGNRLTILTNAGGPGVLATDALITNGGLLTDLSEETMEAFNQLLPPAWSHNNPVDILGDASPDRYAAALEIAANDPNSDGMLVILTPQAMTDPTKTAEKLKPYAQSLGKPVLASWMGGPDVRDGDTLLSKANIPTFDFPDTAARMFDYMAHYATFLNILYETPTLGMDGNNIDRDLAAELIQDVRKSGRTLLTEYESKQLLAAYGIPTVPTFVAKDPIEAVKLADGIGYPVVLKIHSETITHKTDVGGIQLNLADATAVRRAFDTIRAAVAKKVGPEAFQGVTVQPMVPLDGYELILGSSIDPQFGPVILFGMGGQLVEVFKDRALGLPPLNTTLARRMMERTQIYKALKGVRGRQPVDPKALESLLVRFSQLIVEQRFIKELDINPLLASHDRILALDARVMVYEESVEREDLPQLAIRAYPSKYITSWIAKDGSNVTFRPIRAEDEPLLVKFHETLSDRSVYMRYMHPMLLSVRTAHERLARICHCDYNREITLVAERSNPKTKAPEFLGVGRISKLHGEDDARFTLLISDLYQGMGLGSEMLRRLIQVCKQERIHCLEAMITPDNHVMQGICKQLGFEISPSEDGKLVRAELSIN